MNLKRIFPFLLLVVISGISTAISSNINQKTDLNNVLGRIEKANDIEIQSINIQRNGEIYEITDIRTSDGRILSNEELQNIEDSINATSLKPDPGV
jgi:hypothetical protein